MIKRIWIVVFAFLICTCVSMPIIAKAALYTTYSVDVKVTDNKGNVSKGGTLSYETFPQTFYVTSSSSDGDSGIAVTVISPEGEVMTGNRFTVSGATKTGTYRIIARTTGGATKEIAVHIRLEVKAESSSTYKYRTVALQIRSIYLGNTLIKSNVNTRVDLVGGLALAPNADAVLSSLVNKTDGKTYTLRGSLVIEIYTSGGVVGTYVLDTDWQKLLKDYEWVPKTIEAFQTMKEASTIYQAPKKVELRVEWRDGSDGYCVMQYSSRNVVLSADQWANLSANVTEKDVEDKYMHVATGITIEYQDGTTKHQEKGKDESVSVQCYSNMDRVTITYDYALPTGRDLEVLSPGMKYYPEGTDVVTWVFIELEGKDVLPSDHVTVEIEIAELDYVYEVEFVCRSNTKIRVPFKWHTPSVSKNTKYTITARVNCDETVGETDYSNNVISFSAWVQNAAYTTLTEKVRTYPTAPYRDTEGYVSWVEQRYEDGRIIDKTFYVRLVVSPNIDYTTKSLGYIRSGYGFTLVLDYEIETNYDRPEIITGCQVAEVALPQYGYYTYIKMEKHGESSWQLKRNWVSPDGNRKRYVPVWWSDDEVYVIQAMCGDVYTPGGDIECWVTEVSDSELVLKIEGSMYDDDHIGY